MAGISRPCMSPTILNFNIFSFRGAKTGLSASCASEKHLLIFPKEEGSYTLDRRLSGTNFDSSVQKANFRVAPHLEVAAA